MLDGVNDEEQHAHQLGRLLETFEVVSSTLYLTSSRLYMLQQFYTHSNSFFSYYASWPIGVEIEMVKLAHGLNLRRFMVSKGR